MIYWQEWDLEGRLSFSPLEGLDRWDVSTRTMTLGEKWYITSVDWSLLTHQELQELYELEKDMWSHGLWEYIRCRDCGNISSKDDVFWDLPIKLKRKTVSEIERILEITISPNCPSCSWHTEYVFWENYIEDIISRYQFNTSFLCLYKDFNHKIRGFMDGYISDISTIYNREFDYYYSDVGEKQIIKKIESILDRPIAQELLCITALWVDQENASMFIIYNLMKKFFQDVLSYNPEVCGIYESVLGTNTHSIYEVCWAERIYWLAWRTATNVNNNITGDIFIHPYISWKFIKWFGDSLKSFLKENRIDIKKILEMHT